MRITNNMLTNTFLRNLYFNNKYTARAQDQIATGRIVNNPSEDALIADQVIGLELQIGRVTQYMRNGASGSSYLGVTDNSLGEANNVAVSARTLAIQMANGTVTTSMRAGGSVEAQQMLEQAVEVANRNFRGRYIFGGFRTDRPPFELTADGVLYRGDMGHINLRMSDSSENQISINGMDAFGAFDAVVTGSVDLNPILNMAAGGTMLRDLNGGRGVASGGVHIVYAGGPGAGVDVDLSTAESLEDVATLISAATGGAVTIIAGPLAGHALRVNGPAGGVTISEFNGGTTGKDLGILGTGAGGYNGLDIDPAVTEFTRIADLRNGAGLPIDAANGFTIANGSGSVVVGAAQLSGSVGDLLTYLNNSAANVYAEISADGTGLNIYSRLNGPTMTIVENGAGSTAADLGIASAGVRADNLFTSLIDLRDTLAADNQVGIRATITTLEDASELLLRARADVGAREQRFEVVNQRQEDEKTNLTQHLSLTNDLDYSRGVMELQQLMNSLEASLRLAAKVLPMNLADFL